MARWMFSWGMFSARARWTARRRRKFASGSPPPSRAAMAISRAILVNIWPRLASLAPFWRLIWAHLLWPDMALISPLITNYNAGSRHVDGRWNAHRHQPGQLP